MLEADNAVSELLALRQRLRELRNLFESQLCNERQRLKAPHPAPPRPTPPHPIPHIPTPPHSTLHPTPPHHTSTILPHSQHHPTPPHHPPSTPPHPGPATRYATPSQPIPTQIPHQANLTQPDPTRSHPTPIPPPRM